MRGGDGGRGSVLFLVSSGSLSYVNDKAPDDSTSMTAIKDKNK